MSVEAQVNERLAALTDAGTSIWLDQIRRGLIESGELERLVGENSLRGVTSNPAIFEKAILGSTTTTSRSSELAGEGLDARRDLRGRSRSRTCRAAATCCGPVWDEADGADGFVSLEVEPAVAHDTDATIEQAQGLLGAGSTGPT